MKTITLRVPHRPTPKDLIKALVQYEDLQRNVTHVPEMRDNTPREAKKMTLASLYAFGKGCLP